MSPHPLGIIKILYYLPYTHILAYYYKYTYNMRICRDCPTELPVSNLPVYFQPVLCDECRQRNKREKKRAQKKRARAAKPKKLGSPPRIRRTGPEKLPGSVKSRVLQRVRAFVESCKQAPCLDCGLSFPSVCMDFDHRSTEVKLREVSSCKTMNAVQVEMAKCDLVCACCHRIRTAKRLAGEAV